MDKERLDNEEISDEEKKFFLQRRYIFFGLIGIFFVFKKKPIALSYPLKTTTNFLIQFIGFLYKAVKFFLNHH